MKLIDADPVRGRTAAILVVTALSWTSPGAAQQIYYTPSTTRARPQCTGNVTLRATPQYAYTPFAFSMSETVRTASSVPAPTTTVTTYAPDQGHRAACAPSVSYTSWGSWDPNATETASDASDPYGSAAWTQLWVSANPPNFTSTGLYTTTVSPTPIPTSELILPPADYFGPSDCYQFPEDFMFGVAGSAAQIEGATAEQGKAPSLMDVLVQDDRPKDYVTNENYYLYKVDIERIASMGVKYYSFSIPWTRILPFALPGTPVNQAGIDHYDDLINFVLAKGMLPVVTLLHFDTPLQFFAGNLSATQAKPLIGYVNGGWQNATFVDAFVHYAQIVMSHYADRVPVWITINEPFLYSDNGVSVDHVLRAHARVYHWYKDELRGTGQVSIKFNDNFGVPRDPHNAADVFAANHFNALQLGTFCDPLFRGADYPAAYKATVRDHVPLTARDLAFMAHTVDFFAVDAYTATVIAAPRANDTASIAACAADETHPLFPYCVNQTDANVYGWDIGYRSQSYAYITPRYLRSYLSYLYNTYGKPVVITEFGFPVFAEAQKELPDQLFDTPRSIYYLSFMSEVLKSIWEDGVHVAGAFAWSFADNWEFGSYTQRFGLQTVNRTTQVRNYKKSFFDLADFVNSRMPA